MVKKAEIEKSQDVLSQEALQRRVVDYQNKVAYAIMCGVVKYFDLCGND